MARDIPVGNGSLLVTFDANYCIRDICVPHVVETPATPEPKALLAKLSPQQVQRTELAGENIQTILTHAPGNGAPIDGLKVVAVSGWFAARPSGTESTYKIYAESFRGADHLRRLLEEAQTIVSDALAAVPVPEHTSSADNKRSQGRVA
jgi:phosphoglucomutase